eukprot:395532-Amphidinium_carterae.1
MSLMLLWGIALMSTARSAPCSTERSLQGGASRLFRAKVAAVADSLRRVVTLQRCTLGRAQV